ncbi:SRP19 [Symbiodinium microadriaticum]|nr:SRP19 [Symbiodinium microadriaticum]
MCRCWTVLLCWIVIAGKHGSGSEGPERALLAPQPETQKDQGPYTGQGGGCRVDLPTGCPPEESVSATSSSSFFFSYGVQATMDVHLMWGQSQGDLPLLWTVWHRLELHFRPPDTAVATAMGRRWVETGSFPEEEASRGKEGKTKPGKEGKGTGTSAPSGEPQPTVPTVQSLPKPPSAAAVPAPTAQSTTATSSGGPETTLQQILMALNRSRDDLPPSVREILDAQIQEDSKAQAKNLHRLVAAQGAARRQLAATRAARQDYVREWAQYVTGLCDMWRKQQEEKGKALEAFLTTEAQWEQQLAETTSLIAKVAVDPEGGETIDVEDADDMDEEDTRISELAQTEVQRQRFLEQMQAADQKITETLQAAAESVNLEAAELGRPDRERSPRRRTTEAKGPKEAKADKGWQGSEAAPSVGSTLSLTGDVEPITWAPFVPAIIYGHTIRNEWDFTCPRTAQLFGLRMQFEVVLDKLGVCSDLLLDKRQMDGPREGCRVQLKSRQTSMIEGTSFCYASNGSLRSCLRRDTAPKGRRVAFEPCTVFVERSSSVHSFLETPTPAVPKASFGQVQPVVGTAVRCPDATAHRHHNASLARSKVGTCRTLPGPRPTGDHSPACIPERVPPPWACTADSALTDADTTLAIASTSNQASGTPSFAQLGPSQFSEIRLRITANIDLYPADMDRPEIRQQQLTSHDWLTGWRIRGGVGPEAQQDRYALYTTDHHLQLRTMRRGWSINELVADVAGVVPRLRSIRLLVDRLDGLPAIQIAATTREVPATHHAVPLDLRGVRGRVCTLNLEPGLNVDTIMRRISEECPASHVPQQDFQLVMPDNTPLRILPGLHDWPDFLRGQPEIPPLWPQPQVAEEEGDQVHFLQHSLPNSEPISLRKPTEHAQTTALACYGPVLHPQCCQGHRTAVTNIELLRPTVQYTIMPPNVILAQPASTPCVAVGSANTDCMEHPRFYTIFEPRIDLRQRPADKSWQLSDYVTDAVRQLPVPVRMVFILSVPLPSFATPQLVLTLHSAPPRARSLPLDLRNVGGMVHTIEILPQGSPAGVWAALRDKGIDLSRQWEAAHEAGHVRFLDQLGREVIEWGADDDRLEWAELTAVTADWQESVITYGSTEAQAFLARFTSTSTTTAMGPSHELEPRDPPTLLRALAPADACSSQALAGIQVLPAHLASQGLSTISAADLCLYTPVTLVDDGTRPFTVFVEGNPPTIRTAEPQWPMCRFLTEAMSLSDQAVRQVQFLPLPMPDLPTPQFVITPTASLPGTVILPVDARGLGGSICTIAVSEGESGHSIMTSVAAAQPSILQTIQAMLALDAIFLQDAAGQVWDSGPPESAAPGWLALRYDQARLQQAPPSFLHIAAPATTSTTTAAFAAHGPEPILTVVLVPSACVKAHLHALRRTKQSGAVIFIDSAAAYYSIAKDILELTPQQKADSHLLQCRAALLFDEAHLQSEFVAIVQGSTKDLEGAMSPELRRFLQQQLDTTWYVSRRNSSSAYVAGSGIAPGSPLADVMFSLVFGRVLKKTAAFLHEQGLRASIAVSAPGGHGLTPTWADDVSILLQASAPGAVMTAVAQTMSFFLAELKQAGLKANMGPGKTEALLSINGPGARRVRQQIFCQDSPAIALKPGDGEGTIRVTSSYEYLGSLVQADGHALPAILHRRRLAREMFRPIKNRMLRNPALTMQEKIDLVRSRILTRFFYGSGLWTLGTQREKDTVEETVFGFYRGAFRHILAVSSQGYSNIELAGALGLPTPGELLNVERARTVVQLAREGLSTVLIELAHDEVWWTQTEEAVRAVGLAETGASLSAFLPIAAHLTPSEVRAKCKLYLTHGIRARWIPIAKVQPRPACDTVRITAATGPQLPWDCSLCPCAFATRKDLAVHEARKHGKRAQHVLCAVGSRCEVCSTEFWSQARLSEHLRKQPRCLQVYTEGDICHTPSPAQKGLHAWKPSIRTYGPQPWWATLQHGGEG